MGNYSNIVFSSDTMPETVKKNTYFNSNTINVFQIVSKYFKCLQNVSTGTKTIRIVIYKSIFVAQKAQKPWTVRCHCGRNFQNFRL